MLLPGYVVVMPLRRGFGATGGEMAEANRLLIPWFLCFRKSDLHPVRCDFIEQHVDIYAHTAADAKRLEGNANLRRKLDELAHNRLVPWCRKYGFGWKGFRFWSPVSGWTRS